MVLGRGLDGPSARMQRVDGRVDGACRHRSWDRRRFRLVLGESWEKIRVDATDAAWRDSINLGNGGNLSVMKRSVPSTTPIAEEPAMGDAERAERLRSLAERVFDPDGLDREALERIEQLTDDPR